MKKYSFTIVFLINIFSLGIFAQSVSNNDLSFEKLAYLIDKCYLLREKTVPRDFQFIEPNRFKNNEDIYLITKNNIIDASMIIIIVTEESIESIFANTVSQIFSYGFSDPIISEDSFSITLKKDRVNAIVRFQKLEKDFLFVVGFSEAILTF